MTWDQKLISQRELRTYQEDDSDQSLEARVAALIDQQFDTWPLLREGSEAFTQIETKRVRVAESEVVIQHNPKRVGSTAASVDKQSVENRRCFLCPDNLPPEEKGIAWGDDLPSCATRFQCLIGTSPSFIANMCRNR
jgi:hypothetical protein